MLDLAYHVIGPAPNAAAALALFQQTQLRPDVALLDIHLGERGPDGIELARLLLAEQPLPIVFLTSLADGRSFERARQLGAAAYLVKPVSPEAIQRAIELAITNAVAGHTKKLTSEADELRPEDENQLFASMPSGALLPTALFIKENGILTKVRLADICWVAAEGRYCRLALHKGSVLQVRQPLRDISQHLPAEQFVQIQRSYIVNAECIERIDSTRNIVQVDGHLLPIGLVYRDKLLQRLNLL